MLKKENFTHKDIPSVDKTIQVLSYLNSGRELKIGNIVIRLGETITNGFKIMIKFGENHWIGYSGDMDDFSSLCNKLTEEELTVMSANLVLQKTNMRSR